MVKCDALGCFGQVFVMCFSVDCAFVVVCLLFEWSIWIGVGMQSSFLVLCRE